ncbi:MULTISPECIES: WS/DGAT domain-containing protein [unclassified Streptomyces]|uniref:WS/DGAT domain-containing protein n=1 Tax=unclassified Streptomyces TaxID=2593676 RepID=UPI00236608FC|nr:MULTISPECIES: WS/DGAT domain-containing protein [unclassified Streptomyces]MDF3142672.1 WS/DGAT domain-containing protein [Streptomyces sp. T21Q-yed]WDF39205.1 WS/DGAT domain-containing protein [Streptomyces sp. T12]
MRLSCADEMLLLNGCPGVIGLATVFAGERPDVERVRARVAERWTGLERMNCVLDRSPGDGGTARPGRVRWAVPGPFDPAVHVTVARNKLDDLWAESVDRPLGGGVPPWRLFVVPDAAHGGDFALALVAQHVLLDGRSLATLMRLLMDSPVETREPGRSAALSRTGLRAAGRELRAMAAAGQALPMRPAEQTYPSVAVSELSAHTVRSARRQPADGRGATLNELLVGAVAGALRTQYGPVRRWRQRDEPVYTAVPCDLRTRANPRELGNTLTVVRVPLPVDVDGPVARLRACQAAMATVPDRAAVHATVLFPAAEAVRRTGPWVTRLLADRGRHSCFAATATTAMKWPGGSSVFQDRRLVRTVGLPPLQHPGTVSFALAQAGDAFTLTAVCNLRPNDARRLADAVVTEFETWARTATPSV